MADEKKVAAEKKKPNGAASFFKRAGKFFRDCKGEVKKIVWPSKETVFRNTGIVVVTIIIFGVFIFGLDSAFMRLLALVMNVSGQ